jgi:competence protein ComEC
MMLSFALAFLIGDLVLQQCRQLPSTYAVFALMLTMMMCWYALRSHWRFANVFIAFALGFAWSCWSAASVLTGELPGKNEEQSEYVTGYIVAVPHRTAGQIDFLFELEDAHILLKLYWQKPLHDVRVGDKWRFLAKIKRIHGTQNPGEFDYEAWALQKKLRASGSVIPGSQNQRLEHSYFVHPIDQLRDWLLLRLIAHMPSEPTAVWLPALIVGERSHIPAQQWDVLRKTGTNHLMAIAGLHIGIIAGIAHFLVTRIWRRYPFLCLYQPAQLMGAYTALFVALFYSLLSGFSIPTQRACSMLAILTFLTFLRRRTVVWSPWALALCIVILLNPLSVLTDSIWLSFGTIALIVYGMSARLSPQGWWWKWGRAQWVIGIGLIPSSLVFFQQASLVSLLANCVAIPWLGFLILPFCFLSGIFLMFFPLLGALFLQIASKSLALLWVVLSWFAQLPFAAWQQPMPNLLIFCVTMLAFLLLLIPRGMPGRWLALLWVTPLLSYSASPIGRGAIKLTLLDVGQGLAVVVQTQTHTLVYDAGPKLQDSLDAGESVVVPFLHSANIKKVDKLVISHGDNDHIGGAVAILSSLKVGQVQTSVPEKLAEYQASLCEAGQHWTWDEVNFTFLYPTAHDLELGNDSSCVLRIATADHSILLTGDIEQTAERRLLAHSRQQLSATILVAPHHGSQTSIVPAFVMAVHPDYVLYAVGYRNRYHFPHAKTVGLYAEINSQQFDTAKSGAIEFELLPGLPVEPPHQYRFEHRRYWFDSTK